MSYSNSTIYQIVSDIESKNTFLPAIQRKFVWPRSKIINLFDSILRNYPIGSFLFWELKRDKADEYVFYEFLTNYDSRTPFNVKKEGTFVHPEIIGVLDGQQRLSSLYIGLQGTHTEKLKYKWENNDAAYPRKRLYLNLLSLPYSISETSDIEISKEDRFQFKFLTNEEAKKTSIDYGSKKTEHCLWYKVGDVLKWHQKDPDIDNIFDKLLADEDYKSINKEIDSNKRFIKKVFRDLHGRFFKDKIITYFNIESDDLEDVLEIFIRINSGATILSKTDLLFSTIIASWPEGRENIENFLTRLNNVGETFNFSNDFLMRCCLVLSDLDVLFKVKSFKSENVELIKGNWEKIKSALLTTVELISEFGFNGSTLPSQNSIIIIAYYFLKGGKNNELIKEQIKKYLFHSLLANIYGSQGDATLASFRKSLIDHNGELISKNFDFLTLRNIRLSAGKSMIITEEDLEEFMNYKKGPKAFLILSLLYPNLKFLQTQFHQDHIHPDSGFRKSTLKKIGLADDQIEEWLSLKDQVPNLQMMESIENSSKNSTPFIKWLDGVNSAGKKNVADKESYFRKNFIPEDVDLNFSSFKEFYSARKELLKSELRGFLEVSNASHI